MCIADNGGGMDPDKMRHCMSLGYSAKSKVANTIGQCITPVLNQSVSVFLFIDISPKNHVSCLFMQMEMVLKQAP